jgi:uncharacterized protein (DUF342 family)
MEQVENPPVIEVLVSEDGITGSIKLVKQAEETVELTKEMLMGALEANRITFGLKDETIEKLASRPIFNIKIEVAKGLAPTPGQDGTIEFFVKNDLDYKPEFETEGTVDYKNLDYFQFVKKDQVLCTITKETPGAEGRNIFGGVIPAKPGRSSGCPTGKNTVMTENDTVLIAACDGVVRFVRGIIDINDLLRIYTSVDQHTGNINFTGDVTIEGDVCNSFSVRSGGNIIVKGVVEDSIIEAGGNLHISKGINGTLKNTITVNGDLKCHYIENAIIHVQGNIMADYIIDSKVTCMGNIELSGGNEIVLGGEIKVKGELRAKEIGSEKERITNIEVIGEKIMDNELLEKLYAEREMYSIKGIELLEKSKNLSQLVEHDNSEELYDQLQLAKKQMFLIKQKLSESALKIQEAEKNWAMLYAGAIVCKRKLYRGVNIHFGDKKLQFSLDNIEHCRIYYDEGDVVQGTL